MLDTVSTIETPEGIDLALRPAGPVPRFWAWTVDSTIRGIFYYAAVLSLGSLGALGMGIFLILLFLTEWFYPVLFECLMHGQTPGKRVMGLRVVQDNGIPIGWGPSLIRNLLRFVDFLPPPYGTGLITMLLRDDSKRLGDVAAGTLVIYAPPRAQPPQLPPATAVAPPWPLALEQQRALVEFAERAPRLTAERAQELVSILAPLLDVGDEMAVRRVYGYARWLAGQR